MYNQTASQTTGETIYHKSGVQKATKLFYRKYSVYQLPIIYGHLLLTTSRNGRQYNHAIKSANKRSEQTTN